MREFAFRTSNLKRLVMIQFISKCGQYVHRVTGSPGEWRVENVREEKVSAPFEVLSQYFLGMIKEN